MEKKRSIITAIFFLSFLSFTGCGESGGNSIKTFSESSGDLISEFTLIETEKSEKLWVLEAAEAELKKNKSGIIIIDIRDFNVIFFDSGDEIVLESELGHYNKETGAIETAGPVNIISSEKRVTTSNVIWDPGTREFISEEKVEIDTPEGVIRGVGMRASMDLRDIKLTKDIEGRFSN